MNNEVNELELNGTESAASHKEKAMSEVQESAELESENCKKELEELNDKYMRLYAEFDNFKKRKIKEEIEMINTISGRIILELLPIIDDFERALENLSTNKPDDNKSVNEGIMLIYDKLSAMVRKHGVKVMDVKSGDDFNIDLHESVANTPVEDVNLKSKIVTVIQKGYTLNNKVIRFAKVIIYS
jgi:molecular chaperone GrpE